jgi:hypothetical protein
MRKAIRNVAMFISIAGGLFGLIQSFLIVHEFFGNWGVLLGLFLFPLVFAYCPFYSLFVYGSWNLLLLNYGSLAVSGALFLIEDPDEKEPRSPSANPYPGGH